MNKTSTRDRNAWNYDIQKHDSSTEIEWISERERVRVNLLGRETGFQQSRGISDGGGRFGGEETRIRVFEHLI